MKSSLSHNLIQMSRFCNDLHDDERIVFCKTDFIFDEFERLKNTNKKIILIIANSDYTVSDFTLRNCPSNVEHIFATNTTCDNERVTPIPIGVEMEEVAKRIGHGQINHDIFNKKPFLLNEIPLDVPSEVSKKIYSNFNTNTNPKIRTPLFKFCSENENFFVETGISFQEFSKKVKSHIATLSPRGNGIECIRTYEVLYLNSIPIVFGDYEEYKTIYEKIYKKLPVVFLWDYSQLSDFSSIEKNISKVKNNSRELLDYYYWVDLIIKKTKKI